MRPCAQAVIVLRVNDLEPWKPRPLYDSRLYLDRKVAQGDDPGAAGTVFLEFLHSRPEADDTLTSRSRPLIAGSLPALDLVEVQRLVDVVALSWLDGAGGSAHAIQYVHWLGCVRECHHRPLLDAFAERTIELRASS